MLFELCILFTSTYSLLVVLLILVELGCAAFIFFDKSWKEELPTDKTGYFDMIYQFLEENWSIVKWVALGIVVLEPSEFVSLYRHLALGNMIGFFGITKQGIVWDFPVLPEAANVPADYDSDDEFIAPRQQIRQPLINRPPVPATGVPVTGSLDQRPSRNDAWSARMREKASDLVTESSTPLNIKDLGLTYNLYSKISNQMFHLRSLPLTPVWDGPIELAANYQPVRPLHNHLFASISMFCSPYCFPLYHLYFSQPFAFVCCSNIVSLDVYQYGLDTSEFTYNPSESNRYQQAAPQPAEESSRCTIM
ncbi:hypothetical protein Golax_012775 [Gossypium laxum]|uniref:Uncharacterized protein n=1 Tax=Gossypium laxum TaxID=34288 RepID=A0A7J8ZPR2_9ROSI|nr:hypothetical protein [Gossypium laxum]